ncbi:EG45-like domain containing protein [Macadamia integrifolia]|uniref:EG45-like domain containing protein n=1 Tax=Macadamia integrifolia TaxID=60698 RepID=UPI001C4EB2EC|nr:EG45-like domain containing protein [Macadamia integrifolia]
MCNPHLSLPIQWKLLLLFFSLTQLLHFSHGDVGTASQYDPPYLPTACYGDDSSQFPDNNLFGAAGEGIWDNGASCGRQYLVSCLSASEKGTCVDGVTIQIKIVENASSAVSQASSSGTTIVLSATAFASIANSTASKINIEFQQV